MSRAELRTVSVVGARPQFVKLSPVARAMAKARLRIDDRIIHTGQHYDDSMSKRFFEELDIPQPAANLGVGSASQGRQTGRMLEGIETQLTEIRPHLVVVYGDTNSTLAAALAAAKMHIPVAHVEAGLRSFNRRMPEELNRIVTDHLSQALFAPTPTAMDNLATEGLSARAQLTGDVMYDAVLFYAQRARTGSGILSKLQLRAGGFGIATIHRAENTSVEELSSLLTSLNAAAAAFGRIIFPMHPRTSAILRSALPEWRPVESLSVIGPVGYIDMLALLQAANWVLTDSGGLQKEAYFLRCPCITLRNETEWLETLRDNANSIAGNDGSRLMEVLQRLCHGSPRRAFGEPIQPVEGPFGAGHAAERIVEAICVQGESQL